MLTCRIETRWNPEKAECETVVHLFGRDPVIVATPAHFDHAGNPWTPAKMAARLRELADLVDEAWRG